MVPHRGMEVDKAEIDVIEWLSPPTFIKEVRSFLDYTKIYHHFVKDFSEITKPLTQLFAKDDPFVFTDACLETLCRIK